MVTWIDGGTPSITGSDTATKPGGLQYAASGGNGPYTWTISGTDVSVDQEGYVTLGNDACGTYTVTCTDCIERTATFETRVTNNGSWSTLKPFYNIGSYPPHSGIGCNTISEDCTVKGEDPPELPDHDMVSCYSGVYYWEESWAHSVTCGTIFGLPAVLCPCPYTAHCSEPDLSQIRACSCAGLGCANEAQCPKVLYLIYYKTWIC